MELVNTAKQWYKKWSTWLAGSMGGALVAFAFLPERMQDAFPDWFLFAVGAVVMFGIPGAVQVKQKRLHKE